MNLTPCQFKELSSSTNISYYYLITTKDETIVDVYFIDNKYEKKIMGFSLCDNPKDLQLLQNLSTFNIHKLEDGKCFVSAVLDNTYPQEKILCGELRLRDGEGHITTCQNHEDKLRKSYNQILSYDVHYELAPRM